MVSSSGGGGKYITSGFSAYNGHSAIGFGPKESGAKDMLAGGIGIIGSESQYTIITGYIFSEYMAAGGDLRFEQGKIYLERTNRDIDSCAIVF